jgi:hypothetical protein
MSNEKVGRLYLQAHYLQYLFINVSSDFFRKEESDLLSLISFGIEFQSLAPLYMKLFFMLLVERGFGKQRPVEMSRR